MAFIDIIKAVAPTIASALGGPLAGAAVSFIAGKFGTENTQEAVQKAVEGFTAADTVKLKALDLEFQEHMSDLGIKIDLAQIDVNKSEAQSEHWFVAAGRPAVIWVGAAAFAYAGIIEPFARFIAQVGFHYTGGFPVLDTTMMFQVLGSLLGIAGMRSFDKYQGVSSGLKAK